MSLSRRELLYAGAMIPLAHALPGAAAAKPSPIGGPTADLLSGEIGTVFVVRSASAGTRLIRLATVGAFSAKRSGTRPAMDGFSAVFTAEGERLPQDIYTFEHDRVASFTALMVPLVSLQEPRYEIIFNRLV